MHFPVINFSLSRRDATANILVDIVGKLAVVAGGAHVSHVWRTGDVVRVLFLGGARGNERRVSGISAGGNGEEGGSDGLLEQSNWISNAEVL